MPSLRFLFRAAIVESVGVIGVLWMLGMGSLPPLGPQNTARPNLPTLPLTFPHQQLDQQQRVQFTDQQLSRQAEAIRGLILSAAERAIKTD